MEIREQAEVMRRAGGSYKEIFNKFAIPKSTLSTWFSEELGSFMDDPKKQHAHLARIREMSIAKFTVRRLAKQRFIYEKVRNILGDSLIDLPTKRAMLAMLYWAEGAKTEAAGGLKFTNTDPLLSQLYIRLLRDCYEIDESKLRVRLHLHYYHPIRETRRFWSQLLAIPEEKFGKIYIKKRSETKKFRRNFKGICFIIYWNKDLKREVMETAVSLANKVLSAPVVQRIGH